MNGALELGKLFIHFTELDTELEFENKGKISISPTRQYIPILYILFSTLSSLFIIIIVSSFRLGYFIIFLWK